MTSPFVAILMGSDSDLPVMQSILDALAAYVAEAGHLARIADQITARTASFPQGMMPLTVMANCRPE